jgi:hypothetical protein
MASHALQAHANGDVRLGPRKVNLQQQARGQQ